MNPSHLVWLDLETTGLDPQKDRILEVCTYIALFDKPFDAKLMHKAVMQCRDMKGLHEAVLEMHAKNGLWAECVVSRNANPDHVDAELCDALVREIGKVPNRRSLVFAGFSVHFDLAFVRQHFTNFAMYFSHRVYDVSALKLFCRSMGMPETAAPKEEAHRAEQDVLESIEHARLCAEWLERRYSPRVYADPASGPERGMAL